LLNGYFIEKIGERKLKKSELRQIIKEGILKLQEEDKTIKYPTQWGTIHLEINDDAGGAFIDLIVNQQEVLEININNPSGEIIVKQKKKRVKLK